MKPIKLPFGINKENVLVHVLDVESGKKCGCICPDCRSPLIACKGKVKQPHFKHEVEKECKGEGAIHLAAKKLLLKKKQIKLPHCIAIACTQDSNGKIYAEKPVTIVEEGKIINFDLIEEEVDLYGMRVDILAKKSNVPLIIEIFYCHKVDNIKKQKIIDNKLSALEINLSELTEKDIENWESLWSYMNNPQYVKWLHNIKYHEIHSNQQHQLLLKVQKQEQEYKEVEISKVFKVISRYFPFSNEELPDFLNVDIPNADFIFGCDKRIWQTVFYITFVFNRKVGKSFCIDSVYSWLQSEFRLKLHKMKISIGIYDKNYLEEIDMSSSWKILDAYFKYLCCLGILEFTGTSYNKPGNDWFKIISKFPKNI